MITDDLVERLDADTAKYEFKTPLYLCGSEESRFLRGIRAKAKKFGIEATIRDDVFPAQLKHPYVVDVETCKHPWPTYPDLDLDSGLPAVTEAIHWVMNEMDLIEGKYVTIVGRGPAVKQLPEMLISGDATVTVCHSKTPIIAKVTPNAGTLILATPRIDEYGPILRSRVVIDIGGACRGMTHDLYIGSRDIGRLTTAILVNRYARKFGHIPT